MRKVKFRDDKLQWHENLKCFWMGNHRAEAASLERIVFDLATARNRFTGYFDQDFTGRFRKKLEKMFWDPKKNWMLFNFKKILRELHRSEPPVLGVRGARAG